MGIVEEGGMVLHVNSCNINDKRQKYRLLSKLGLLMHPVGMSTLVKTIMKSENRKFDLQAAWTEAMCQGVAHCTILCFFLSSTQLYRALYEYECIVAAFFKALLEYQDTTGKTLYGVNS